MKRFNKKVLLAAITGIAVFFIIYNLWSYTTNKVEPVSADKLHYDFPAPQSINPNQAVALGNACKDWFTKNLLRSGFNGAMLVAQKGNVLFTAYSGFGHLRGKDTVAASTPFHIASVSKTFTAMSTVKLWQDHLIDLDDLVSKYFPSFNYPGVTVRSLLNHRSGLPNYVYFMEELGWDKKKYVTNQDVLDALINRKAEIKNIEKPNNRFCYCNTNYALLALIIEKVSGKTYAGYLKENIFDPLGMKNTFVFTSADSFKTTPSYDWRGVEQAFTYLDKVYGDKNIYSNPEDLFKWDRLLTTEQFLNNKSKEEAFRPYSLERPGIKNYGLGWRMFNYPNDYNIIYHNGWWHGNNAVFLRMPKEDATIIVLGNRYNRNIYHARDLMTLFNPHLGEAEGEE